MQGSLLQTIEETARVSTYEARKIAVELGRASQAVNYYMPDRSPFDYQQRYLDDFMTKFLIGDKGRQIGWSQMISIRAIIRAIAIPRYKKVFCSLNLEDAREKIDYANEMYDAVDEVEVIPAKTENRKMSMRLANGSRLISVFSPRGKSRADISLDEFAHYSNPRKVYQATLPIMIHPGTQLDIGSTTLHSQTMFKQIVRGDDGKYTDFKRIEIFWWDCPIHCRDVVRARRFAPTMPTDERVKQFGSKTLIQLFNNMITEDFQQEFELIEMDDELSLLSWDLIHQCTPTGDRSITRYTDIETLKQKTKDQRLYCGFDVGRWKDKSELTVLAAGDDNLLFERYIVSMHQAPFQSQEDTIDSICSLPNCARFEIDATGMGEQLGENAARRWPDRAIAVKFSHQMKATLATALKMYMEKRQVMFYPDRNRIFQMHSIKKEVSRHGNVIYGVDKSITADNRERHHGDVFWSRALAVHGHAELHATNEVNVTCVELPNEDTGYELDDALRSMAQVH